MHVVINTYYSTKFSRHLLYFNKIEYLEVGDYTMYLRCTKFKIDVPTIVLERMAVPLTVVRIHVVDLEVSYPDSSYFSHQNMRLGR